VGGNRSLCGELAERVAMHAKVLGRAASIQPRAGVIVAVRVGALHQPIDDQVGESTQYVIEQRPF
jgi:hypothetical protein